MMEAMRYQELLSQRTAKTESLLCVGLDPRPERLSDGESGVEKHLLHVVEQTYEIAAAYKPNLAYFEAMGLKGLQLLETLLEKLPAEVPVVLDAKRSDIGETQQYYAKAYFQHYGVDAVTLNPLMGYDSITPFLDYEGKGVYLLALTSNAGSADFMRKELEGKPFYLRVTELGQRAQREERQTEVGYVMGLTNLGAAELAAFPDVPLLIPGLGAQGGDLSALQSGPKRGAPNLVNVSRGVLFPASGETHYDAAMRFAERLAPLRP